MNATHRADRVERTWVEKSKAKANAWSPRMTNRSVRPPGSASRRTLPIKFPFTRLLFGSRARKKEGTPMVRAEMRESWMGTRG